MLNLRLGGGLGSAHRRTARPPTVSPRPPAPSILRRLALALAAIIAASVVVLLVVMAYLDVFGVRMGLPVSSLDGSGPQWPFAVAYIAAMTGATAVVTELVVLATMIVRAYRPSARNASR